MGVILGRLCDFTEAIFKAYNPTTIRKLQTYLRN